uniref:Non-specific serine/threonine protein kinase n=1 Tax=Strongyloides stercoralis TaxID=6248 RepID=A0A0K0DSM9_STRER
MFPRCRSVSNHRNTPYAFKKHTSQSSKKITVISNGKEGIPQTTISKPRYLRSISSTAIIENNKTSNDGKIKVIESKIKHQSRSEKNEISDTITDWSSDVLIKKPLNFIDRKYESYCIDDTTNGTLLFNNTKTVNLPNVSQKMENIKMINTKESFQTVNLSSNEETSKTIKSKPVLVRQKSRSCKRKSSKDTNNIEINNNISKIVNESKIERTLVNTSHDENIIDKTYTTTSPQQTTVGFYSEFKNECQNLLNNSKVLCEISSLNDNKSDIQLPDKHKTKKVKKVEKIQPSPIPKEEPTEVIEINSDCFKEPYPVEGKNTFKKANRLTFVEQLEMTLRNNDILLDLNDSKHPTPEDQLNKTYRNNLEELSLNLNSKCLSSNTSEGELSEKIVYNDTKIQEFQALHLSESSCKNINLISEQLKVEEDEMLFVQQQFLQDNECNTEMIRQCSNTKIATVINTATQISNIQSKKSDVTCESNAITNTNTQDTYSTMEDNDYETKKLKNNNTSKTFTNSEREFKKNKDITKKLDKISPVEVQKREKIKKPTFINPSIINDFRDEMIQSVNDVCDFLSQKVKNDTAVNLVEERFIENTKFLYKFFFHSCREPNL